MQLSAPSPAVAFIQRNQFLTKPTKHEPAAVQSMRPIGADTVEMIVVDGWTEPDQRDEEMNQFYADTAATALESVVDGVKLIVRTPGGYVGEPGYFSGDEQYFANTLPGLTSQAAEIEYDLDGDGTVGEDEAAFVFPVASQADADRLDPLIVDQMGDYPVRFEVENDHGT